MTEIRAFGRGQANIDRLCALAGKKGLTARVCSSPREALEGADLIVSSVTLSFDLEPFIDRLQAIQICMYQGETTRILVDQSERRAGNVIIDRNVETFGQALDKYSFAATEIANQCYVQWLIEQFTDFLAQFLRFKRP